MPEKMAIVWKRGKTLGTGSFGFVSLVELDKETSKTFNLPPLMAIKSSEAARSSSLKREEKFLDQLKDCHNIINCFGSDITRKNGTELYNIFLEYAPSGSLASRIKGLFEKGILMDEQEVKRHARSLLSALSFIHERGFVHCDVKPHNVLLMDKDGALEDKLADFGLAKRVGKVVDEEEDEIKLSCGIRGTIMYMAPESVGHEYEPPCDVWALGCVVLEMITGRPPWDYDEKTSPFSILYRIGFGDKVPEIPDWVSEVGKDFLGRCFVRDPKDRWTADMLLKHPFVSSFLDKKEGERIREGRKRTRTEKEEMTDLCNNGVLTLENCWKLRRHGEGTFCPRNLVPLTGF